MTEAVDTATTTASGTESATSQAQAAEQQAAAQAQAQGQQQPQQQSAQEQQAAPSVPEQYSFANLPEGYSVDDAALTEWSPVFKELGLTQEQAEKLVALDAKRVLASQRAAEQAATDQRNQMVSGWEASLKADPNFGGANFDANVATASEALAAYGSPELSAMLKESGLGSHPEVVRFFHRVGKEIAEGKLHRTTTEVPAERPLANRMYPNYPA
ncbi:peptidase [Azotobacter vinelandii]|uniref:peptidase n=1 Tax=Azotobacter vinelandii TaxID=354 RepID=UPI000910F8AB|nr:peptidase [Azotobacter vinelandii]SFY21796.1 hypothetical protein SAMN04244547_04534 [Azotobacter vinelandii]